MYKWFHLLWAAGRFILDRIVPFRCAGRKISGGNKKILGKNDAE
jgi:hypothetical protein